MSTPRNESGFWQVWSSSHQPDLLRSVYLTSHEFLYNVKQNLCRMRKLSRSPKLALVLN